MALSTTFKNSYRKPLPFLCVVILLVFLFQSYNTFHLKKEFASDDLRNRVVGSRILEYKKNVSPYYYKWNPQDGDFYYDIYDSPSLPYNRNTVTPFVLQLLYPLNSLPFDTISLLVFFAELAAILSITIFIFFLVKDLEKRFWVLLMGFILIGCSQGFRFHNLGGQVYVYYAAILFPVYFLYKNENIFKQIIAGVLLALLVLTRPVAAVFLLPLLVKKKWKAIIGFTAVLALYFSSQYFADGLWVWENYFRAMHDWSFDYFRNRIEPTYDELNVISTIEGSAVVKTSSFYLLSEDSSLRGFAYRFLNLKLFTTQLLLVTAAVSATVLFYFRKHIIKAKPHILFIIAFIIYIIAEICLPAIRNSYNYVQWLFPVMLLLLHETQTRLVNIALAIAGILAPGFLKFLPFDLTLAELIFAAICIYYIKHTNKANA
jgi:Glycosyltransferase family 87